MKQFELGCEHQAVKSECPYCERDRLQTLASSYQRDCERQQIEIDRLKAELGLQKETCRTGFMDRDAWKAKAERYKKALRLAVGELENVEYEGLPPRAYYEAKEALE